MLKSKTTQITPKHNGLRFDVVAAEVFSEELSRKKIKSIIDGGGAYLNKKRVIIAKVLVKTGDKLEIFWEENTKIDNKNSYTVKNSLGTMITADVIIFENQNFYVINKPAGIAAQATLTSKNDTIIHALCALDKERFQEKHMFLVHRLDKETSGLMIIAKNKETQFLFETLFKEKKIQKTYEAICFNSPKKMEGKISYPIAKDNLKKNAYYALLKPSQKSQNSKEAETDFIVKKRILNGEVSIISCFPKTGRTHQIRVHLSAIGCPILGDKTYAQNIHGHRFAQLALRHMLHACKLKFELKNEVFNFDAPYPTDFLRVLSTIDP